VARSWIEGKAWAGKGETRDEARGKLIKFLKVFSCCCGWFTWYPLQDHVKKTMDKGLYTLEDGELIPEPTLSEKGKVGEGSGRETSWTSCPNFRRTK
jgi:hypothetical protein